MSAVDSDGPASIPLPLSPPPDQLQYPNISLYPDVVLRDPVDENYARSTEGELATSREDLTEQETETPLPSGEHAAEVVPDTSASPPDEDRHASGPRADETQEITRDHDGHSGMEEVADDARSIPPAPPAKPVMSTPPPRRESLPAPPPRNGTPVQNFIDKHVNGHAGGRSSTSTPPSRPSSAASHRRSLTISKGHTVSVVLISSALETIAASREAKRSAPLRESVQRALEMVKAGQGGDRPREIFEPLRLACETRNEKLMIASLDCISKLISYSFFVEHSSDAQPLPSPPLSPAPTSRNSLSNGSQVNLPSISLVDVVVHTITSCHSENAPETVSLQIVKALLALVLSSTILVHQSSLLKAVRTVYNVFLLSTDPVNQTVAQGGLTQMVHHVFTRCKIDHPTLHSIDSSITLHSKADVASSYSTSTPPRDSVSLPPQSPPVERPVSLAYSEQTASTLVNEDEFKARGSTNGYDQEEEPHESLDIRSEYSGNGHVPEGSHHAPYVNCRTVLRFYFT